MIHKLSFKNFYSFLEETTIDLVTNKNTPDTDAYFTDASNNKLTKLMAFIGPNASGKTNLLKCLSFISWFVQNSFSDSKPDEEIAFKPFLFCSKIEPSIFNVEFEINNKIYKYELELTVEKVLSEKLSIKDKRFRILFERIWDKEKSKYNFNFKRFNVPTNFSRMVRNNASIISTARQVNHTLSLEIIQYFMSVQTNIIEDGKIPTEALGEAIKFYQENPTIREMAEDILNKFDLGLSKIKIDKIETQDKKIIYVATGAHKYIDNDKEILLPLQYESAGTKNLLFLLRTIIVVLKNGGVAVLDEMDNDLHPFMVPEIVNLFTSKIHNPKHAQLLFSTHNVQILNKLDKQQIILVEKNKKNISEAWNLSDVKGVRADDNFYSKYMAGAYGAVPKV
ncbi:MAG: AAA family ATPase [Patescibacteria group bacterium]